MSAAFLSLIWVFLITLQLAYLLFFCGRMILIKWRLLETSPPLTKWTKSRGWCTDDQTTTGSACQDCHLLLVSSQQELVLEDDVWASCRPNTKLFVHTGGTRRKAGASWESVPPPMALPPVSPPPSPPTHPATHSPLSSYIPGALFFAGKHSSAAGGEMELFWRINGNSTSRMVLFTVRSSRFTALSYVLCSVPGTVKFLWCKI